jgi:hypothetical protein
MALCDDVKSALEAATWTTITEPTFTIRRIKQTELKVGYGWVDSNDELVQRTTFGRSPKYEQKTSFEIFITCATEANYELYKANVKAIIEAKVITNGYWEIIGYPKDEWTLGRFNFYCLGYEKKLV